MYEIKFCDKIIQAEEGENLLDVLQNAGFTLPAVCGGNGHCKKCKVVIENAPESATSRELLSPKEYGAGIRLACHETVHSSLSVKPCVSFSDDLSLPQGISFSAVIDKDEFIDSPRFCAVDIGTTSVSLVVFDKENHLVKSVTFQNPQISFGADVLTRITAANAGNLDKMCRLIREKIASEIEGLGVSKVYIAANCTMLHILANVSPRSIGVFPYTASFCGTETFDFRDFGFSGDGTITLLPSVSAYIGADIVAGAVALDLQKRNNTLLVDLGTNGEIMLSTNGKLYAASAACGPALEGGNITFGSYFKKGACARVSIENGFVSLDEKDADCICGSGLIDLAAKLLTLKIISGSGELLKSDKTEERNGQLVLPLNDKIYLSQGDIRALQLAKSAICSTVEALLCEGGITADRIERVFVAGGFANSLNFASCGEIGLLPKALADKCVPSGNTSLIGAYMCAKDNSLIEKFNEISDSTGVIDLAANLDFFDTFTKNLAFYPEEDDD